MISAGYIGGGIADGAAAAQSPATPMASSNGSTAISTPSLNNVSQSKQEEYVGKLENYLGALQDKMKMDGWSGLIGQGIQLIGQFINGWMQGRMLDIQQQAERDGKALADEKLANDAQIAHETASASQVVARLSADVEKTKSHDQKAGAVEIAQIKEKGQTERAAMGNVNDIFNGRPNYPYGFPIG